mgnify:CR=1 FL=1
MFLVEEVFLKMFQDGKRKIVSISEVYNMKDGEINLKEIFSFKQKGLTKSGEVNGSYIMYKYMPFKSCKSLCTSGRSCEARF